MLQSVRARRLLCHLTSKDLRVNTIDRGKHLDVPLSFFSHEAREGREIARKKDLAIPKKSIKA